HAFVGKAVQSLGQIDRLSVHRRVVGDVAVQRDLIAVERKRGGGGREGEAVERRTAGVIVYRRKPRKAVEHQRVVRRGRNAAEPIGGCAQVVIPSGPVPSDRSCGRKQVDAKQRQHANGAEDFSTG